MLPNINQAMSSTPPAVSTDQTAAVVESESVGNSFLCFSLPFPGTDMHPMRSSARIRIITSRAYHAPSCTTC